MHVYAFSTPQQAGWRWRIMNYAGEVVEESRESFPSIARAVAEGSARLERMNVVDRTVRVSPSQLRLGRRTDRR
ncbi:MAG: hypothetical protein ACREJ9_00565 [Candidatus Rokuibacteriota bacterium]